LHVSIESFKFSLYFADQAAPGAFEKQVAIAPTTGIPTVKTMKKYELMF
jgi:hypothetical protein